MRHVKEPDGVDFMIKSRTLTKEEETALSNYIRSYKTKKIVQTKSKRKKKKSKK